MFVNLTQAKNALSPIVATLLPIIMLVKLLQALNASEPILVTLFGNVIIVKPAQPENALLPILLPPVTITVLRDDGTELFDPNINPKLVFVVPFNVCPTNGIVILVSPVQSRNALLPMLVTLFGIVTLVNPVQPENAL